MTINGIDRQGKVLVVTGGWLGHVCTEFLVFFFHTKGSFNTVMLTPIEARPWRLALLSLELLSS